MTWKLVAQIAVLMTLMWTMVATLIGHYFSVKQSSIANTAKAASETDKDSQ